jgi:hypothetical protein
MIDVYGHCTNCHREFEPREGNTLCPDCARAYVAGIRRAGGDDLTGAWQRGRERGRFEVSGGDWGEWGREHENRRLRDLFFNRLDHGFETFADVVNALWPDGGDP